LASSASEANKVRHPGKEGGGDDREMSKVRQQCILLWGKSPKEILASRRLKEGRALRLRACRIPPSVKKRRGKEGFGPREMKRGGDIRSPISSIEIALCRHRKGTKRGKRAQKERGEGGSQTKRKKGGTLEKGLSPPPQKTSATP